MEQHIPSWNSEKHPKTDVSRDDEPQAAAKEQKHRITVKTADNQSYDFLVLNLAPHRLPLFLIPHSCLCQSETMKGKGTSTLKRTICKLFNQHIPHCGVVVLEWADCRVSQPHLFVYRGGVGRSSATQKPWADFSFSALQFSPRQLPKKHKYGLRKERVTCFLHPLHCR